MDDLILWRRIKDGDTHALKELHDHFFYPMCLYGTKVLKDGAEIEDVVSECFIKLWVDRGKISIKGSLKSYLFYMMRNAMIDVVRKSKNSHITSIAVVPEIVEEERPFEEEEFYSDLYFAISKLPDQRRKILELAVYNSYTYKEIAEELNISVNTVKTQIARAYHFLKEELDPKTLLFLLSILRAE